ncbi:glycosyltransferase [Parafrigoribacterium mesophilum]|uniref:glycosyltransferase n=1 Tax=Parafrigoribacterium mesophilum TaxID=433646 RepID=UPI0031FD7256
MARPSESLADQAPVFPPANYLIATSRLHPGLDGGQTVALLRRARHFRHVGGASPLLVSFDFTAERPEDLAEFQRMGLADERTVVRNLYQDARNDPTWLHEAARPLQQPATDAGALVASTDLDSEGVPWRTVWRALASPTGTAVYTDYLDRRGRPLLRTPYLSRQDWHHSTEAITVFRDGMPAGHFRGFGELYRAWLSVVIASGDPRLPTFIICESRQIGELITPLSTTSVKIIHTVHNAHTRPPYRWNSDMEPQWQSWFEKLGEFDAVVWLTAKQEADVIRRFGRPTRFAVIPHPVDAAPPRTRADRDVNRAVMIARLAPQKRVDSAIRAFLLVRESNPRARFDIFGDGPAAQSLTELIVSLGLRDAVRLRGYRPDAAVELENAALLTVSSGYEGQSLAITEAFARGCPVVAYDVNYGPGEMVVSGRNGFLVPAGDIRALADAMTKVLGDSALIATLSAGARATAAQMSVERAMSSWSRLFRTLLTTER